jgi:PAS domain S-box-containing protein
LFDRERFHQAACMLICENSKQMIILFDKEGKVVESSKSAADLLGYGDGMSNVIITDVFRKAVSIIEGRPIFKQKFYDKPTETVAYRQNQTCFEVELKVALSDDNEAFAGICLASDISEKKMLLNSVRRMKEEVKNSEMYKNEIIANISHELKTPVNGICGFTEYLLGTELTNEQRDSLQIIKRCCSSMNMLISELMDYAKLINNKLVLEEREFNFRQFISDLAAFNINGINEKNIKLIVNISNDIPDTVIGDEFRLSQILNNLLSNAIKFTHEGQIAIEVTKTGEVDDNIELFFMVIDTGIGISREDMDKIFISFTQVDGSITRRFGGTGLGLSICKKLVEAMGGTISVESEINKGSTFSFSVKLRTGSQNIIGPHGSRTKQPFRKETRKKIMEYDKETGEENIEQLVRHEGKHTGRKGSYDEYRCERSDKNIKLLNDLMERLILCIEMENWEKAEEAVDNLKKMLTDTGRKINRTLLRLVMAVRKEQYEESKLKLTELKELVKEECHE